MCLGKQKSGRESGETIDEGARNREKHILLVTMLLLLMQSLNR